SPALSATPHVHEQIIATLQRPVFGTTWHFRQMLRSQLASTTPGLNVEKFPKKYLLPQTAEVGLVPPFHPLLYAFSYPPINRIICMGLQSPTPIRLAILSPKSILKGNLVE
ncbi:MAG: hypothetical protein R6V59_07640, partial [Dehalococcoidia bacterium]